MTNRRAYSTKSAGGAPAPRNRSKSPSLDVEEGAERWTVEEPVPTEPSAMNFVHRRWAEPRPMTLHMKIYVAGDDASRGLQYRACLRRAHVVAGGVPTPAVFEDRSTRFSGLEALVRNTSPSAIVIFSTIARRAAGDRIEAMKLALADRAVEFIEVPEWYRGFADIVPRAWSTLKQPRTKALGSVGTK